MKVALHGQCREKRSQALQRCNLTRDISVDRAPMVLTVPDGPGVTGDPPRRPGGPGNLGKQKAANLP